MANPLGHGVPHPVGEFPTLVRDLAETGTDPRRMAKIASRALDVVPGAPELGFTGSAPFSYNGSSDGSSIEDESHHPLTGPKVRHRGELTAAKLGKGSVYTSSSDEGSSTKKHEESKTKSCWQSFVDLIEKVFKAVGDFFCMIFCCNSNKETSETTEEKQLRIDGELTRINAGLDVIREGTGDYTAQERAELADYLESLTSILKNDLEINPQERGDFEEGSAAQRAFALYREVDQILNPPAW